MATAPAPGAAMTSTERMILYMTLSGVLFNSALDDPGTGWRFYSGGAMGTIAAIVAFYHGMRRD